MCLVGWRITPIRDRRPMRQEHGGTTKKASHTGDGEGMAKYLRFGAMIATSVVVMYALTYANTYEFGHARFSEMRVYMALLMGSAMAIVMLGYMWGMYRDVRVNIGIVVGAVAFGLLMLFLARSQVLVGETSYMRAMIPHHSIAILTSERAGIEDVRVRELAGEIIEAQKREIAEMEWLIADIEANGPVLSEADAADRPVPSFSKTP